MPAINFYHLTRSTPEAALFKLLSKAYQAGHRSIVRLAHDEDVAAYDTALWTRDPDGFLPHGTSASKHIKNEPILLTSGVENSNKADFAFIFPETSVENLDFYERVFFLFEGASEAQVKAARGHWKMLKDKGFELIYWTQDKTGKWSKKKTGA